jgi:hypothetical protein
MTYAPSTRPIPADALPAHVAALVRQTSRSADFTAEQECTYRVDTTGNAVIIVPGAHVNQFTLMDHDGSWTDTNHVRLNFGTDFMVLGTAHAGNLYMFMRDADGVWHVYTSQGEIVAEAIE